MKMRVTIDGNEYDDGGLERATTNLQEGNDVIVEGFYYERDKEAFENLAAKFSANVVFSTECATCLLALRREW